MAIEHIPATDTAQPKQPTSQSASQEAEPQAPLTLAAPALPPGQAQPASLASRRVLQLQGLLGNQTVQRMLQPAQQQIQRSPLIARDPDRVPVVTGEVVEGSLEEIPEEQPAAAPPAQWGSEYKSKKSRIKESYDTYKGTIGKNPKRHELKSASSWGKNKQVKTSITSEQLTRIIAAAGEAPTTARIAPMAGQMSSAFETMGIDTAQAQAAYIAHMAGETGGVLEETGGEKRDYAPFQGRGPVQVTHEYNYVQSLAYIETRAEQLEKEIEEKEKRITELEAQQQAAPPAADSTTQPDPAVEIKKLKAEVAKAKQQVTELREAHAAVKGDPKKAADPKYAFLFSAAFMHMTGAVKSSSKLGNSASFTGKGTEDSWVTGGNVQQGVAQPDGSTKDVSMTFEQRRQYAADNNMPQLEADMNSAISRGAKKSKVYGMAVSVISSENTI